MTAEPARITRIRNFLRKHPGLAVSSHLHHGFFIVTMPSQEGRKWRLAHYDSKTKGVAFHGEASAPLLVGGRALLDYTLATEKGHSWENEDNTGSLKGLIEYPCNVLNEA